VDGFGPQSRCPSCGDEISTAAAAAAHVCPKHHTFHDPTQEEVSAASALSLVKAAERAAVKPTPAKLLEDARKICEAVVTGWDGEVECIVALVPKNSTGIATVRTAMDRERARYLLRAMLQRLGNAEEKVN
jgi:hypothetical protein